MLPRSDFALAGKDSEEENVVKCIKMGQTIMLLLCTSMSHFFGYFFYPSSNTINNKLL